MCPWQGTGSLLKNKEVNSVDFDVPTFDGIGETGATKQDMSWMSVREVRILDEMTVTIVQSSDDPAKEVDGRFRSQISDLCPQADILLTPLRKRFEDGGTPKIRLTSTVLVIQVWPGYFAVNEVSLSAVSIDHKERVGACASEESKTTLRLMRGVNCHRTRHLLSRLLV